MTAKDALKEAIQHQTKEWAEIYRHDPNGMRAMLLGVENGIERRLGSLSHAARVCPVDTQIGPFTVGLGLAYKIPASILRPFEKSSAARVVTD